MSGPAIRLRHVAEHVVEKSNGDAAPYLGLEGIESGKGALVTPELPKKEATDSIVYRAGDVLFGKLRPYLAKSWLATQQGTGSGELMVLRARPGLSPRFLLYTTLGRAWLDWAELNSYGSKMPRTSWEEMADFRLLNVDLDQQELIADYLDREVAQIDAMIDAQQRLVGALTERRRAIVSGAVTLGIRQAPVVASGTWATPWTPSTWRVTAVKEALESLDHRRVPLSAEDRGDRQGEYSYYGASGVIDHIDEYLFDEKLVLVSEDGANLLMRSTPIAFTAEGRYWVNNHAHVLRPRVGPAEFWAARIEAVDVAPIVTGSAQPKLTAAALGSLRLTAPSEPSEMAEIVEYIQLATASTDALLRRAQESVVLLRERRAAVITAAVTGRLDPRTGVERVGEMLEGAAL